jgi:integrase
VRRSEADQRGTLEWPVLAYSTYKPLSYRSRARQTIRRPASRSPVPLPEQGGGLSSCSTRQYARIIHCWIEAAGLDSSTNGTHSMRRTEATLIYKRTKDLRAVQLLLGHTKLESNVQYLGIEVDDAAGDLRANRNLAATAGGRTGHNVRPSSGIMSSEYYRPEAAGRLSRPRTRS